MLVVTVAVDAVFVDVFLVLEEVVVFLEDTAFDEVELVAEDAATEAVLLVAEEELSVLEDVALLNIDETLSNTLPPWVVHCGK